MPPDPLSSTDGAGREAEEAVEKVAEYLRGYTPARGGRSWLDHLGNARKLIEHAGLVPGERTRVLEEALDEALIAVREERSSVVWRDQDAAWCAGRDAAIAVARGKLRAVFASLAAVAVEDEGTYAAVPDDQYTGGQREVAAERERDV